MTKRLVSFDNEKPDLGLPDAVQERMDARYSTSGTAPHIGPNGNWWVGETDTGTPAQGDQGVQGIQGIQGPKGEKGDAGEDGRSVTITGTVATIYDLPQEGSLGEGYITDSDGHLHIWGGSGWTDVGEIRGPRGVQGPQGDPGERGPQGYQGIQGIEGPEGPEGPKGDTGPAGTTSFLELNDVPPTFPPSTHTHTKSNITDLETISTAATTSHIVKRTTNGNITIPTVPNASTSAASKNYVDTEVGKKANTSHTHTKSNITDLETISTSATVDHVVKRTTSGNIVVPATPNANTSAASKQYVDNTTPWVGTRNQYDALGSWDANRLYIIKGV